MWSQSAHGTVYDLVVRTGLAATGTRYLSRG